MVFYKWCSDLDYHDGFALLLCGRLETLRGKVIEQVESGVNLSCHCSLYGSKTM